MFVVDTNILLYAVNDGAPEHERCRALVEAWRSGSTPWFCTWGVAYEFLRVATHPRVFRQPLTAAQAWSFVEALLVGSLQMLTPTEAHAEHLAALIRETRGLRGNLFHDLETVALMREHGIATIQSRDADFDRFRGVTRMDPLE